MPAARPGVERLRGSFVGERHLWSGLKAICRLEREAARDPPGPPPTGNYQIAAALALTAPEELSALKPLN
ncbi:unnamed protein product [Colias eurytheme]|nr:unnamed protein product [Colias eurytheme]